MFEIPIKTRIINSDAQVALLEDDGTPYADGDVGAITDGFILTNFLEQVTLVSSLVPSTVTDKLKQYARAAAVQGVTTFTVTSTDAIVNDSFTIELQSLDGTNVHVGQQKRYFKRYQIKDSGGLDSADDIATAIRAAINLDPNAEVVATGATADVIITPNADVAIVTPRLYSSTIEGTTAYTTPASVGNGNYENLINIEWNVKGKDYFQNIEELPIKGATYDQWDFTVTATSLIAGYGGQVPGVPNASGNYNFRLYVNTGTDLHTALVLLKGDIDAIT